MIDDRFRPTFNGDPISRSVIIDLSKISGNEIVINSIKRKDSIFRKILLGLSFLSTRVSNLPFFLFLFLYAAIEWRVGGDAIDFSPETRRRNANIYM